MVESMSKSAREHRIPIMFSDKELESLEDWRFSNRIPTRAATVRKLCQMGMISDHMIESIVRLTATIKEVQEASARSPVDQTLKKKLDALYRVSSDLEKLEAFGSFTRRHGPLSMKVVPVQRKEEADENDKEA